MTSETPAGPQPRPRPMRIEHVALWARDVDALAAFYARHFGAQVGAPYENPAKGFRSRFVAFAGGARLELMSSKRLALPAAAPGEQRLGFTHLAFALGSEAEVDALTARLRAEGGTVVDGPRRTGDGYYESVVLDPEGNRLELTV